MPTQSIQFFRREKERDRAHAAPSISEDRASLLRVCRCAEFFDDPYPFISSLNGHEVRAAVLLRSSQVASRSVVIPLMGESPVPIFILLRPEKYAGDAIAQEIATLRAEVDIAWRRIVWRRVVAKCKEENGSLGRLEAALHGPAESLTAVGLSRILPPSAKRRRRNKRSPRFGQTSLTLKEAIDWSMYLRVIAGTGIGITLEGRLHELGYSTRSFRRLCARLRNWVPLVPSRVSPLMIIDALTLRLSASTA